METDKSCVLVLQKFPIPLLCVRNPACTQDASGISNSLFPPLVSSIHPFLKNEEKRKILGSKRDFFVCCKNVTSNGKIARNGRA